MATDLPAYTAGESTSRPAGLGLTFCCVSAVLLAIAAAITLDVLLSPEFAADFDGGSHTAQVSRDVHVATGSLIGGALTSIAAIIRGGGHRVRPVGILLLFLGAPSVSVLSLPLLDYYG
jgi:hypothetical protein